MWWLSASVAVVYLGFYLTIVFLTLGIACALFYLAELIEEYTNTSRRLIGYLIKAEICLLLVLLTDRLPLACVGSGIAAQVAYARFLRRFPYNSATAAESLASGVLFVVTNVLWVRHLRGSYHSVEYIISFLLVTSWLVPFALLMGVSGDQTVLPGAGGAFMYPPSSLAGLGGGAAAQPQNGGKQRRGLALRAFDFARRARDGLVPDVLSRLPGAGPKVKD